MASRVRPHTRKTASGGRANVRQHSRSGRPRKPLLSPGRAWKNLQKAWRANKRKKRAVAGVLTAMALAELLAWALTQGTSLILLTFGILAIGIAGALGAAGGIQR